MYESLSAVYDRFMGDIPYDRFAALFDECASRMGGPCARVIDLGCGTGTMFPALLRRARVVVGVDASASMLAQARERAARYGQRVILLEAKAETLRVPVLADACVAFCDVMNYVLTQPDLIRACNAIGRSMRPGGWFLFDVHSVYHGSHEIGSNVYYDAQDEAVHVMRTEYGADGDLTYDVLLFVRQADGLYARRQEVHRQKVHRCTDLVAALLAAGFMHVAMTSVDSDTWRTLANDGVALPENLSAGEGDTASRWVFLAQM